MAFTQYYSDGSNAITAEIITQKNYIIEPDQLKVIDKIYIFASPRSTLKVFVSYDGKDWEELGTVTDNPKRFDCGMKKCHYLQLKITESSSNEAFQFDGYTILYELSSERR